MELPEDSQALEDLDISGKNIAYPSGGMLRSLMADGERAAKALMVLHRKFYHASEKTMKRLLEMAGCPEAVIVARSVALGRDHRFVL